MGMNAEEYLDILMKLLPPGQAYPRGREGVLPAVPAAMADEFALIDARVESLLDEADPRTTLEMLPDWERMLALPDECTGPLDTVEKRRQAIISLLTDIGGQSIPFYINYAAALGYTITITEFRPFTCNTPVDRGIYEESARYTWRVNAPATSITVATCQSPCSEPLRAWGNQLLECSISKKNRASRTVIFSYGG